jgi:hypothetical protein
MLKTAACKAAVKNQGGLARILVPPKNRLASCKQALLCEIIAEVETPRHLLALLPSLQKILVPAPCEITAHHGHLLDFHAVLTAEAGRANNDQGGAKCFDRCGDSRLIKTSDRISERPPRGGLSVCATCCSALVVIGTSLRSLHRKI